MTTFISFSLKRQVTTFMLALCIVIFGVVSFSKLPIDLLPNMEIPYAIVSVQYSGAAPKEVENLITKQIEGAVASVSGITSVSSISSEGSSLVIAEFTYGTDMNFATLNMREKIDLVKAYLPDSASSPLVMALDPNASPIIQASLSGSEDLAQLQAIAEDVFAPRLERIDGVASVSVSGGYKNKINVSVNTAAIQGYGMSISYLSQILAAENLSLPSGQVQNGDNTLSIRTTGEFSSINDIRNLVIPLPSGGTVLLSEIANVDMAVADQTSIVKLNGTECINISIQKQSGTNTVKVAEQINNEIAKIAQEYPAYHLSVLLDQSDYINLAIDSVANNAILGAILAMFVLFLFLQNLRTTMIIGISIPMSIVTTLVLLYFTNVTLNIMTLGGLALGVGMMVDNSIVVLENIFRYREEGHSRFDSALLGTKEVALAISASTLTTIAVFLPIVFIEGITSTLFRQLALSITMSLVASLVVALTIVPLLCYRMLPRRNQMNSAKTVKPKKRIINAVSSGAEKIFSVYKMILKAAISHRVRAVLIAVIIFCASIASMLVVGSEFFPSTDQSMITISVSLPNGSELADTDAITNEVVSKIEDIDEIEDIFSYAGSGSVMMLSTGNETSSSIYVNLVPVEKRDRGADDIVSDMRSRLMTIAGAEISVSSAGTMDISALTGSAISISVSGDDLDELSLIAHDLSSKIKNIPGVTDISYDLEEEYPEVQISINRQTASRFGLTAAQISSSVSSHLQGVTATRFKMNGTQIDVDIKGSDTGGASMDNLKNIPVQTALGTTVPLELVADIDIVLGPNSIVRVNQSRTITISGDVSGRDVSSVNEDIEKLIDTFPVPAGYAIDIGGETAEIESAFSDLTLALILSVVLVFVVLASQFESLLIPFSILLSIPLGFSGGFLALFIFGMRLSVIAFLGMIMLSGIVVNNAIVLIDYIKTRRESGESRDVAILNAGPIRVRPVLMTTLTTILGLVPLSYGVGNGRELLAPMAVFIIGGLSLSTVLTLVFIPVAYSIIDDISVKFKGWFGRKPPVSPSQETPDQQEAVDASAYDGNTTS